MRKFSLMLSAAMLVVSCPGTSVRASDNGITLDTVVSPSPNRAAEPLAEEFSLDKAAAFLDSAALTWQKERKCFTCHTNFAYLYARPLIKSDSKAHLEVREFAEQLVTERWQSEGPRWDAEVVAAAAALAFNDRATSGTLSSSTRTALDRMWTVQQKDGGWSWLKCDWPPMESDDHYGVTLAAIATGTAPDHYADTEAARKGLDGIRHWLSANPAPTLHHEGMLLWASSVVPGLITDQERAATVSRLKALQRPDGGWALASLGNWKRGDEGQQDVETSDGYGTGFVMYVLIQSGESPASAEVQRGLDWLKSNQRESGRWYTRSLFKDNHHFISHAGTAMAVMAIQACGNTRTGLQEPAEPSSKQ